MPNEMVKLKRKAIAACMTCPLCNKLFRDATTINECLHTFCRKCISKKLSGAETRASCPVCKTVLGGNPLENLRPDHNLQDLMAKIFPYKRLKVKEPEVVSSPSLPVRRKERSLSSLVVSTPRVSPPSVMTGRRLKRVTRKSLKGSSFSFQKVVKKEEDSAEDFPENFSSLKRLNQVTHNMVQNSSSAEPSTLSLPGKEIENDAESSEDKVSLCKPLNCSVKVANRKRSSKFPAQGSTAKSEALHSAEVEGHARKGKVKQHGQNSGFKDEKKGDKAAKLTPKEQAATLTPTAETLTLKEEAATLSPEEETATLEYGRPKKLPRIRQKKRPAIGKLEAATVSPEEETATLEFGRPKKVPKIRQKKRPTIGKFNVSPQAIVDGVSARCENRNHPIWFSLVASSDKEVDASFPQISASYLRIKDANITISMIQKYLMRKLGLSNQDEVEIRCLGQPLAPTLQLNKLVDLWLQTNSAGRVSAVIGTSAKDFVMVLAYSRKTSAADHQVQDILVGNSVILVDVTCLE